MDLTTAQQTIETHFRAAELAGRAGDPGAISAELVQAALVIGTHAGVLQVQLGPQYPKSQQSRTISRWLSRLQQVAVASFAQAAQHAATPTEPEDDDVLPEQPAPVHTPYSDKNEYLP